MILVRVVFFFFQAEDGIRDVAVTGVQTCALPILNRVYLSRGTLHVTVLGRGIAWLDTGTPEALLQAANYVAALEERQGLKVGAIEEVAYRMGFVDASQLERLAAEMKGNAYAQYLLSILDEDA